jgi:hypothetical protein
MTAMGGQQLPKPTIRNLDSSMAALSQLQTKGFLLVWVEN